jgi:hypothetical protein
MPEAHFAHPATSREIDELAASLGHGIPDDLRALLLESNGIESPYSTLIYSTSQMAEVNNRFRTDPAMFFRMPFDHALFFGSVGNGDEFMFPVNRDRTLNDAVFIWSHETDSREEYAIGLAHYIAKYAVQLYTPSVTHRQ